MGMCMCACVGVCMHIYGACDACMHETVGNRWLLLVYLLVLMYRVKLITSQLHVSRPLGICNKFLQQQLFPLFNESDYIRLQCVHNH